MNNEIYIQHQFERLTKHASPQELLDLADRLKAHANSKLATVSVIVESYVGNRLAAKETITIKLSAGKPNTPEGSRISDALKNLTEFRFSSFNSGKYDLSSHLIRKQAYSEDSYPEYCCPGTWVEPRKTYTLKAYVKA